jgi:shikimate kinase
MKLEIAASPAKQAVDPSLPGSVRRLVLAGFMGAGKTTVGRLLAARLAWDFVDLDAQIEARAGLSVPAIFAEHGERHFRRLESVALAGLLGRTNLVLALGGGAPEELTNRLLLEQTPGTAIVFLDAPFPALFDRCMLQALNTATLPPNTDPIRPLLADPAEAERRFLSRRPIYRRLARVTVDTSKLSPENAAHQVLAHLNPSTQDRCSG